MVDLLDSYFWRVEFKKLCNYFKEAFSIVEPLSHKRNVTRQIHVFPEH